LSDRPSGCLHSAPETRPIIATIELFESFVALQMKWASTSLGFAGAFRPNATVPTAVLEGYTLAAQQFAALRASGAYDAHVAQLRARYASTDPSFEGIRQAVFAAIGGYANQGPSLLELGQL
jgi:hypothetical protein